MSPPKFSIGLWSGDWAGHSITLILLVWNQDCLLTGVFGVAVLLKHPFRGHFLFRIRQRDLLKYFGVFKRIHDPWYAINRQPIIFCTSLCVFPFPINFLIKVRCSSEQCLEQPILLRFSEGNAL